MRTPIAFAFSAFLFAATASAAPTASGILSANHAAMGGAAWDGKGTLTLHYSYSGQGMTGTTGTQIDVQRGLFVDTYDIGPNSGANGYDGTHVWLREASGTITYQGGGDTRTLAANESYRDRNAWWRPDFGGADVKSQGQKAEDGRTYDVLTVTPKGGKPFTAWFDAKTHLLARTREMVVTLPITTFYSDYSSVDGVQIAHKIVQDDSTGVANRQTQVLKTAGFSPARPAGTYAKPAQTLHDFKMRNGATRTTVPFRLINNHIYADVYVNGKGPFNFIFDTGGHDILTPPTARTLGVKVIGSSTSTGAGEDTVQSGSARVQSIRIGDIELTGQPVTVLQFSNAAEGIDEQGMIGYEVFARFVTVFDFARHTLTFIDPKHFDSRDAGTAVPFRFYFQFPEMDGSYNGIPGRFGIDTGARTALSLNRVFAENHNLRSKAKSGVIAQTGWGVGGPTHAFVTRGDMLTLGDVKIAHPLTEFSTDKGGSGGVAAFPSNVGTGILKRFVVTLDYANYRMFFKPIPGGVPDLDTFDRSGMWINDTKNGNYVVIETTAHGPAETAGIRARDVITAVDGKPAKNTPLYDARRMLRTEKPGTVVTFTVLRGGKTLTVPVTLKDQF